VRRALILGLAALAAAAPSRGAAQQPDSARRDTLRALRAAPAVLTVRVPTLVVVSPSTATDTLSVWTTAGAVAAATEMERAHLEPRGQLVDRAHAAVSVLPPDLRVGFVLAAPRFAPMLVRGAVPRAALEDSARAFLRIVRRPGVIKMVVPAPRPPAR
jgi:hypothetical protein